MLLGNEHAGMSWFFLLHSFIVFTKMAAKKTATKFSNIGHISPTPMGSQGWGLEGQAQTEP